MKERKGKHEASPIIAGDVQGTGIVIGHGSSVSVTEFPPSVQADAAALLDEFILLLARCQGSITDAPGILESAETARAEVLGPSPKWPVVRGLLRGIAASVTTVGTLAEAIEKVQALIAHLPT
jgi:hypothetical protein